MKLFNYIDNVELSQSMKNKLIAEVQETPQRQGLSFASKNLIAIGASAAAIILMFGAVMMFLPNGDDIPEPLASDTVTTGGTTGGNMGTTPGAAFPTEPAMTTIATEPPATTGEVEWTAVPETTWQEQGRDRLISAREARVIAIKRYTEGTERTDVEVKSLDMMADEHGFFGYRIELWSPRTDDKPYYRVDVDGKTGEVVREYRINFMQSDYLWFSSDIIKVVSGGREHSLQHWRHHTQTIYHEPDEFGAQGVSGGGRPLYVSDVGEFLNVIVYNSDFEVVAADDSVTITGYWLYNYEYDIIDNVECLSSLDEIKNCIVAVGVEQNTEDEKGFHWNAYQFWFKIQVE